MVKCHKSQSFVWTPLDRHISKKEEFLVNHKIHNLGMFVLESKLSLWLCLI